jgi:predicted RNA binding protein YcfA (HicA-like mRNA interferase family)
MTKKELEKILKKEGFKKHSGGRHDIWVKPGYPPVPLPRHKGDIPKGTLHSIMKSAGLEQI